MSANASRRVFTRVPVHIDIEARSDDGHVARGRVHDISLAGVSMETGDRLPDGARCSIDLVLHAGGTPLDIALTGHVVRQSDGTIALATDSIDPEGYEHLMNLLLYNAPNARDFEDEVESLADRQPPVAPL